MKSHAKTAPMIATAHVTNPERLAELRSFALLDSPSEEAFDRLSRLATRFLEAPVALVSLVDADRQFFKSCIGLPEPFATKRETPLEMSFCQHNHTAGQPMVIEDSRNSDLLRGNLAIEELDAVAYLGYPLATDDGYVLGSFCVLDTQPRHWSPDDIDVIEELAASVMCEIQLRAEQASRQEAEGERDELERLAIKLETAQAIADASLVAAEKRKDDLLRANAELEQFVYIASHDLQEPVRTVRSFVQILSEKYSHEFDEQGRKALDYLKGAGERMSDLIRSLLDYSRLGFDAEAREVELDSILEEVLADLSDAVTTSGAEISRAALPKIQGFSAELRSLFQNLLSNSIKFSRPGAAPRIDIAVGETQEEWTFTVADNGIGIDPKHFARIFEIFQQLKPEMAAGGTGIGLAHCKKIVEIHGGRIWVDSEVGQGTTFHFTIPKELERHP